MSAPLLLRAFVNERLTAATEEIFGVFEKTISKYEEEVSSSQQEIERLTRLLLDVGSNQKTGEFMLNARHVGLVSNIRRLINNIILKIKVKRIT